MNMDSIFDSLRRGTEQLSLQNATEKNAALKAVCRSLKANKEAIFKANEEDVKLARAKGTKESLIDRLSLNEKKLADIIAGVESIILQTDPIGEETCGWKTPGGLHIRQVRVPVGVVAIIYESRPNVTVDAFALAYKSANAILLRGSSSALNSNMAIVKAIKEGLASVKGGIPEAVELAPCKSHDEVTEILTAVGKVDLVLPRGSAKLIKTVVETAKVPVIETGSGVCHLYVDQSADLDMAARIAVNGKIQRPGVCNALECIVVNKEIAADFIPKLAAAFDGKVEVHADEESYPYFEKAAYNKLVHAQDQDFGFEFLDLICAIKTVASIDQAIEYINTHNTKHSESIITNNMANARLFQAKIDASCVYVNASTRFTDGGEFGFGAELGISTQKIHARGPMGIKALTTTKYLIDGNGQIRE
ncbi:MAG: glutamate-5-semialdehyde dehydrogenase [Treponema sp.]|nr:glutamate-5-semialdehyde dehydrogenase [Spirochaetia bacterium]MDD7458329.1 glutamate-5-semialdehyde dehydrogenase [Spirochaetales bacterium]MDY5811365.1 glutamate-5-semialdehyde dehydrogenase [Treponema sp.]MEE1182619.1 glutamate-5-semialdehyde dehydrogenase [Treponema sp.]